MLLTPYVSLPGKSPAIYGKETTIGSGAESDKKIP
jgi:hypothetical protein